MFCMCEQAAECGCLQGSYDALGGAHAAAPQCTACPAGATTATAGALSLQR